MKIWNSKRMNVEAKKKETTAATVLFNTSSLEEMLTKGLNQIHRDSVCTMFINNKNFCKMNANDDLEKLIENLPFFIREHLNQHIHKEQLIEIVLDFWREFMPEIFLFWSAIFACEVVSFVRKVSLCRKIAAILHFLS